jgi:hypothetical protein
MFAIIKIATDVADSGAPQDKSGRAGRKPLFGKVLGLAGLSFDHFCFGNLDLFRIYKFGFEMLIYERRTMNYQLYSTNVEYSLQIHPFLTNKANFQKSQMDVSDYNTKEYEQMDTWSRGKNKPNSNPIQSQYKPNTKPIQTQTNPISKSKACFFAPKLQS